MGFLLQGYNTYVQDVNGNIYRRNEYDSGGNLSRYRIYDYELAQ